MFNKIRYQIEDIHNKIIISTLLNEEKKLLNNIKTNNQIIEYNKQKYRVGVLKNEHGTIYVISNSKDIIKSSRSFKASLNLLDNFLEELINFKSTVYKTINKQFNILVHNLISINAHNIQEIYNIISQDELSKSIPDKKKFIRNKIQSNLDKTAIALLKIMKNNNAIKSEFSVYKKLFEENPKLSFKTKIAIDLNIDACKTILFNKKYFNNTLVLNKNIMDLDPNEIEGEYDLLLGGFPCVTFSMVGKRAGIKDDINGKLYESYASYVEHFKPKVFLAENVKGILSSNKGEALKIIKKRFENTGYNLKIYLVNFADFGVPQLRERVLFIGVRKDLKTEFIGPEIVTPKHITSYEAFKKINKNCINHKFIKQKKSTTEKLKAIPEGGNFRDLPSNLAIKGLMSNIYRKLDRNKPSYTVLASGGGGTWTYHYEEPRALTNRERARLQGFPDDYKFIGGITEVRRQIGNAVPPVGIYPFAKNIELLLKGVQLKETNKTIKALSFD
jgi:DNA (cytosine-5)-methyltransferase 1